MRIIISDVLQATCDLTGKADSECLKVRVNDTGPEITCLAKEFIKLVRLEKRREVGNASPTVKEVKP